MRITENKHLNQYVNENLHHELQLVKASPISPVTSTLSIEERVLIYKYSEDGYEFVNSALLKSKGVIDTDYGKHLVKTIGKLPNYKGLVYRSANLTQRELGVYQNALEKNTILVEYCFISSSKSILVANMFGGKCRFSIISKTGKEIETYSKYGPFSGQNEKEVLFAPNCKFNVLEITKSKGNTLILMEEVES